MFLLSPNRYALSKTRILSHAIYSHLLAVYCPPSNQFNFNFLWSKLQDSVCCSWNPFGGFSKSALCSFFPIVRTMRILRSVFARYLMSGWGLKCWQGQCFWSVSFAKKLKIPQEMRTSKLGSQTELLNRCDGKHAQHLSWFSAQQHRKHLSGELFHICDNSCFLSVIFSSTKCWSHLSVLSPKTETTCFVIMRTNLTRKNLGKIWSLSCAAESTRKKLSPSSSAVLQTDTEDEMATEKTSFLF